MARRKDDPRLAFWNTVGAVVAAFVAALLFFLWTHPKIGDYVAAHPPPGPPIMYSGAIGHR